MESARRARLKNKSNSIKRQHQRNGSLADIMANGSVGAGADRARRGKTGITWRRAARRTDASARASAAHRLPLRAASSRASWRIVPLLFSLRAAYALAHLCAPAPRACACARHVSRRCAAWRYSALQQNSSA
jgi:hypothetical protein